MKIHMRPCHWRKFCNTANCLPVVLRIHSTRVILSRWCREDDAHLLFRYDALADDTLRPYPAYSLSDLSPSNWLGPE
jgi:hypothetical protein